MEKLLVNKENALARCEPHGNNRVASALPGLDFENLTFRESQFDEELLGKHDLSSRRKLI